MKDNTCCTFHDLGGPTNLDCDNYGRDGGDVSATREDYDEQPAIHASDLCDWDAYSNVDAEEASGAVDAVELPSID